MSVAHRLILAPSQRHLLSILAIAALLSPALAREGQSDSLPSPSVLFQELYARVQTEHLFADSKTFADAVPKRAPAAILSEYRAHPPSTRTALTAFIAERFVLPVEGHSASSAQSPTARLPLQAHIATLWPALTRPPLQSVAYSSQLPLKHRYVVPGGRFRELYYWDSYFTMLGLVRDGQEDTAVATTENFANLIERYGHIPNGSRTYYLSRSQPPMFFLMAGLTTANRTDGFARYLATLRLEYAFWMDGAATIRPGEAAEHVVAMPDGAILNRYWDALDTPRDESYREDVALAMTAARPAAELYRDVRTAAESGWDFSSRWLADGHSLATIETTALVPVDLNSLLFGLEQAIAAGCARAREQNCAAEFAQRAAERRAAIHRYLWDEATSRFLDYHWRRRERVARPSAAMLYPLFVGLATAEQARNVANVVRTTLLVSGGLQTTAQRTGHQWDAPNGWAPLQWIAISGLNAYGENDLARQIATRWLSTVSRTYGETGKLLEKYDVQAAAPGGGGEYPLQDGFGWTNGVTRALLELYPEATSQKEKPFVHSRH